jgi:DNA-binding YbaB/EbfC family protein
MNIQALMAQAQKAQENLSKKLAEFEKKVFEFDYKNGSIIIQINGKCEIRNIKINDVLIDPDDKETLQEMIAEAVNEAVASINSDREDIQASAMPKGPVI